jgi:hypothetical protein
MSFRDFYLMLNRKGHRILFISVKSLKTIDIRKVFNKFSNFNDEYIISF